MVSKIVKKLKNKNYIYKGKLEAPKGEQTIDWKAKINYYLNQHIWR